MVQGWGTGCLNNDAADLHELAKYLREAEGSKVVVAQFGISYVIARLFARFSMELRCQAFLCAEPDCTRVQLTALSLLLQGFVLIGHSTGCQDAVRYAEQHGASRDTAPLLGVVLQAAVRVAACPWLR